MNLCLLETTLFNIAIMDFWGKNPNFHLKKGKKEREKVKGNEYLPVRNDTFQKCNIRFLR